MLLAAHPTTPGRPVHRLEADVRRDTDALRFRWRLQADLDRIRIPAAAAQVRTDSLWRHTCFEAFVAAGPMAGYCELNFSPSGEWAAYHFSAYRAGMTALECTVVPEMRWWRSGDALELEACLGVDCIPGAAAARALHIGLAAVIEDETGHLSYWALHHPQAKPDFHDPDGFALVLAHEPAGAEVASR
jgi:hypothetical protein